MPSFAGRAAVVTGAAHGIGRATAELLIALGARVIAVDHDERALAEVFGDGRCTACPGSLTGGGVERLAEEIWDRHGPIDMLVNNVGIDRPGRFLELDRDDFDATFDTNLRGPWFFTKRLAQHLISERRNGAIVFVSSLHDHIVRARPHYSASKAAVSMLVKELATELAPYGIRVNAVSPGAIRSAGNPIDDDSPIRAFVPLGRIGQPGDVARMTAMLLSEEWSGYVTGANVPVDGGLGLHSSFTEGSGQISERNGVRGLLRRKPT
jgi:glucose 1-dehydrogenase